MNLPVPKSKTYVAYSIFIDYLLWKDMIYVLVDSILILLLFDFQIIILS